MHTYKKVLAVFCGLSLLLYLLLSVVPLLLSHSPRLLLRSATYLLLLGAGALALGWFLRKDLNWVATTLGALGIVVLAVLLATATDLLLPHQL